MAWFLVPWITWNSSLVSELVWVELLMEEALTWVREGIWRSQCRAMCLCHLEHTGLTVLLNLSPPHPYLSEFLTLLATAAHGSCKELRLLASTLVANIAFPCLQLMLPLGPSYAPYPTVQTDCALAWGPLIHPYQSFTAFGEIFLSLISLMHKVQVLPLLEPSPAWWSMGHHGKAITPWHRRHRMPG